MVFKWSDHTPGPPHERYIMHDVTFFNGSLVLGVWLSFDPAHPGFHAFVRGDQFQDLGHFKSLAEAKNAAEQWFRQELLALDF
jgi:hypothetical protein